ncbi:WecB/TagA/CpsF family glycosyltransferase [Rubellimicrobium rubrum]|uniref:WecB/TagA/CpsF family glycosyltransferase n=1 Tax=Rubellimicrobium rubrum TaxID=2585369 RepID=A0A5C4MW57_9RHOB|nr:WecB/TagA/CpsF family glycosyltransferase [Rubellimicrobium rubrum]TNC50399.1 WecB/TagA/CpsF family glycosyltransferase [Rubellimicrobium rubrum]
MEFVVGSSTVRVTVPEAAALLAEVENRLSSGQGFAIATLNLDHLVKLASDKAFRDAYAKHDLVTADGNPIVWLARAADCPVQLIPGADLIRPVLTTVADFGLPVGFVGSTSETLVAAQEALMRDVQGLDVRGRWAPPMGFDPVGAEAEKILDEIAECGVRLVLVALGAPKQEQFAALGRLRHPKLGFLSIGAGLDFFAGTQRRAPIWVRRMALEWLWRMFLSPRRLALRYLDCALVLPAHLMRALALRAGAASRTASALNRLAEVLEGEDSFLRWPFGPKPFPG